MYNDIKIIAVDWRIKKNDSKVTSVNFSSHPSKNILISMKWGGKIDSLTAWVHIDTEGRWCAKWRKTIQASQWFSHKFRWEWSKHNNKNVRSQTKWPWSIRSISKKETNLWTRKAIDSRLFVLGEQQWSNFARCVLDIQRFLSTLTHSIWWINQAMLKVFSMIH